MIAAQHAAQHQSAAAGIILKPIVQLFALGLVCTLAAEAYLHLWQQCSAEALASDPDCSALVQAWCQKTL